MDERELGDTQPMPPVLSGTSVPDGEPIVITAQALAALMENGHEVLAEELFQRGLTAGDLVASGHAGNLAIPPEAMALLREKAGS